MKTLKPQRLGFAYRTFEALRRFYFVPTTFVWFAFDDPKTLLPELGMWEALGDALGAAPPDEGMPKPRGELLLTAKAFAPGAVPAGACVVRARVGTIDKSLAIFGDRFWEVVDRPPLPFTEMAIAYDRAFGGDGFALNPLGKGARPTRVDGAELHPLPNIEDPRRLLRGPGDRPSPAGFGAIDMTWPQRRSKMGTYDAAWLKDHYPGYAPDIDWSVFNTAPDDQQQPSPFRGDEEFELENLHPTRPRIASRLPGVRARCFAWQRLAEGERLHEVAMHLDTVHLFPHLERGLLIYRGVLEVADDEADDVVRVLIAAEDLGVERPAEHYLAAAQRRLDPKLGALHALRDEDLVPLRPGQAAMPIDGKSARHPVAPEGLLQKNMRQRSEDEAAKVRAKLESARASCTAARRAAAV